MSDELAERASRRRKLRLVLPGEPDIHGVNVVIKRLEIDAMSLERPGPVDHVGKDIQGGVVQGLGYALHEEVTIGANGRVCQNGFETYRVPLALDVVPVEISLYEGAPSVGPLGTKGAGEVPILNVGATIACAVANPTGKRVQELPLTPPRVLELLLDRKGDLRLPHIAEAWADNLVRPHDKTAQK